MTEKIQFFDCPEAVLVDRNKCVIKFIPVKEGKERDFLQDRLLKISSQHIKEIYEGLLEGHLCGYVALPKDKLPKIWHGNRDAPGLSGLGLPIEISFCREETDGDNIIFGFACNESKDPLHQDKEYVMAMVGLMELALLKTAREML